MTIKDRATQRTRVLQDRREGESALSVALTSPTAQIPNNSIIASSVSFHVNEASHVLTVVVKYSDGTTLRSGTVNLATVVPQQISHSEAVFLVDSVIVSIT